MIQELCFLVLTQMSWKYMFTQEVACSYSSFIQNCQNLEVTKQWYIHIHHSYGRKWRGIKEPLDEGERVELKSWFKTQQSKNEDHGIQSHHFYGKSWGNFGNSDRLFSWAPKSLQMVIVTMKLKDTPWKESYDQPRQHVKKQRHHLANKDPSRQSYGFSSSPIWMWDLDYK